MAAARLSIAPGALGGLPDRAPPGSPLRAGRRPPCPSACSPTVVAVKQLAPAACSGTAAAAADGDRTEMLAEVEFFVGENVRYWSDTHGIWMEAVVVRINFSAGASLTYDLDVKRGARADRIRKAAGEGPPRTPAAQDDGTLPLSEAGPKPLGTMYLPRTVKGLTRLLAGDPSGGEAGGGGCAEAAAACKSSKGAPESCDACAPVPTAAKLLQPVPLVDEQAPLPQFEVGNQVVYWSDTYHQWMEATVVKKREGGATYDLDVKRGASARRMKLLRPGECTAALAAAQDERTPPSRLQWSGPSSPLLAGRAVQAHSPSAVVVATPQSPKVDGVVHHPAQMASALSPQSSRGPAGDGGAQGAPPRAVATVCVTGCRGTAPPGAPAARALPGEDWKAPACLFMGTGVEGRACGEKPPAARSAAALAAAQPSRRQADPTAQRSTGAGAAALEAGELRITTQSFDPSNPSVRAQLLGLLGLGPGAVIEEMKGFKGGLNEGVWFASDRARPAPGGGGPGRELVLKLVRGTRIDQNLLTEGENLQKIAREHPKATSDPALAFPLRVVAVVGLGGARKHDLIVMRKVRGERLAEVIARKWYRGEVNQIMRLLERLGTCLGEFHTRYSGVQHGDFQPSNIIYDDERDALVMIDVGGMGVPTMQGDVAHFCKSLRLLAEAYGTGLANDGTRRFEQGYARGVAAKN